MKSSAAVKYFVWFILSILAAGSCVGYAWRDDSLALLGLFGLGVFLSAQLHYQNLLIVFTHSLLTGYLTFLIANGWMHWTIDGLGDLPATRVVAIVHGIHLFHGGLWCLFAVSWWFARRFIRLGWMLAPALWLIVESLYPAMFPVRQGCLLGNVQPLIQIAAIFGVAGVTLQAILVASLLPLGWSALGKTKLGTQSSESSEVPDRTDRGRSGLTAENSPFGNYTRSIADNPQVWANPISRKMARHCFVAIIFLTAMNYAWGTFRIYQVESAEADFRGDHLDVLLVQGETEYAGFHYKMLDRTRQQADCELVLWPECSLGHYRRDLTDFSDEGQVALKSIGIGYQFQPMPDPHCYLLGGGYSWTQSTKTDERKKGSNYVSAYLIDPQQEMVGRHDKIELMVGGECLPGDQYFPELAKWLYTGEPAVDESQGNNAGEAVSLSRGTTAQPVGEVHGMSVAAMLCCEDMYPWLSREMVNQGADLLVCLANGMSFNTEVALWQHFEIARFRAIENNRYFLRCGSYGVSGLVSPTGKLLYTAPCFEEADLKVAVPIEHREVSIFTRFGDSLTWASYALVVGFTVVTLTTWRRER